MVPNTPSTTSCAAITFGTSTYGTLSRNRTFARPAAFASVDALYAPQPRKSQRIGRSCVRRAASTITSVPWSGRYAPWYSTRNLPSPSSGGGGCGVNTASSVPVRSTRILSRGTPNCSAQKSR